MQEPAETTEDEFSVPAPNFSTEDAERLSEELFGISGSASLLDSERDQNFRIEASGDGRGESFVLKIANPAEDHAVADMQVEALLHIARVAPELPVPKVCRTTAGEPIASTEGPDGRTHSVRMVTFAEGVTREPLDLGAEAIRAIGETAARLDMALRGFFHPSAGRYLVWDLRQASSLIPMLEDIEDPDKRALATKALERFRDRVEPALAGMRAQVIHNDLHADNVVVDAEARTKVTGIIDFGDLVHSSLVCDLAVTTASLMYGRAEPFDAAAAVIDGFTSVIPLESGEVDLLPDLVATRLAAWVTIGAWRVRQHPENAEYILAWDEDAWNVLRLFDDLGDEAVHRRFREICEGVAVGDAGGAPVDDETLLERRRKVLGPTLPLTYDKPVHIVRGEGVWLYDAQGRAYLDAYNNVPVAGHSHPRVVEALVRQARLLNTNTRYLHETIVELSERLVATMPEGLDTVLFVNSGSEANDTAWRLASVVTGGEGAVVTDFAYHGITVASSGLSPEEWPKGFRPPNVATVPAPDSYRGKFRADGDESTSDWAEKYATEYEGALALLAEAGCSPAITCIDTSYVSDGVFTPPPAYLEELVQRTRAAGALFIADEVQGGYARTGEQLWSFARSDVTPDFVTLGKPMGNGHPVAAVVTRRAIVEEFAEQYPEFFSTFGGNTVAAAVALAVLDVVEQEGLQQNAAEVGEYLLGGLRELASAHESIGDVRGQGLMIGVEMVSDGDSREPDPDAATRLANGMRERGVLIGTCSPLGHVLKIRPPLVFTRENADQLVGTLGEALRSRS